MIRALHDLKPVVVNLREPGRRKAPGDTTIGQAEILGAVERTLSDAACPFSSVPDHAPTLDNPRLRLRGPRRYPSVWRIDDQRRSSRWVRSPLEPVHRAVAHGTIPEGIAFRRIVSFELFLELASGRELVLAQKRSSSKLARSFERHAHLGIRRPDALQVRMAPRRPRRLPSGRRRGPARRWR